MYNILYIMSFNVFRFKEHIENNSVKTDNQFIVIYDDINGFFYYYGTRNRPSQTKYILYSGKYHYTRLQEFVQFIDMLVDGFFSLITTEIHQIDISPHEYNMLDFNYLSSKMTESTILTAYDCKNESFDNMYTYLETLIAHEV